MPPDPQRQVDDFLTLIEEHLDTGKYDWARDTLEGIHQTVEQTNRVTLRQREAVERIIVGRLKHDSGRGW